MSYKSVSLIPLCVLFLYVAAQAASAQQCFSSLNFTSESGKLYVNGLQFKLKGASWFGFETPNNVVHGLWSQSYTTLLDFLATNGFNAIRMPFYLDLALNDAQPDSVNYGVNADLQGLSSLQVMDKIVSAAADRGLLIMFDLHSFQAGTYMSDNMWYNSANPVSKVQQGWGAMAKRYASHWNVIAADLKNEPYGCTWGTGNANTDWNLGAATLGNYLHQNGAPNWLIFVEGVAQGCTDNCFWGENVSGAKTTPVLLDNTKKLVYSPHVYGPTVYGQPYFSASNFPSNMPAIWDAHFGSVADATGNAVVIGEWGGPYTGTDETWLNAIVDYMVANGRTDQFFWCLNPDSGDTGGLLKDDWSTPDSDKLTLLKRLVSSPTKFSTNSQGQFCVSTGGSVNPSTAPSPSPAKAPSTSTAPAASSSPVPSPSKAAVASPSSAPKTSPSSSTIQFASGSSVWWFAVTIPGSTSVQCDCGDGRGWQAMAAGWTDNLWTYTTAGAACTTTIKFKVNGGSEQTAQLPSK